MNVRKIGESYYICKDRRTGVGRLLLSDYYMQKGFDRHVVKPFEHGCGISIGVVNFPPNLLGRRVRLKIEVVTMPGEEEFRPDQESALDLVDIEWEDNFNKKWTAEELKELEENLALSSEELEKKFQRDYRNVLGKIKGMGWDSKRRSLRQKAGIFRKQGK